MPYDNNVIHNEQPGRSCSNLVDDTMCHPCLLCDDSSMCPRGFGVSQMSCLAKKYSPSYILHFQIPQGEHWTSPWFMDYPDQRRVEFLWSSYAHIRETIIEVCITIWDTRVSLGCISSRFLILSLYHLYIHYINLINQAVYT